MSWERKRLPDSTFFYGTRNRLDNRNTSTTGELAYGISAADMSSLLIACCHALLDPGATTFDEKAHGYD